MSDVVDQPSPIPRSDLDPVWPMVVEDFKWRHPEGVKQPLAVTAVRRVVDDMHARDAVGRERYGTPLTAGNGRDSLVDAYQELLDGAVYLKAEMIQNTASAEESTQLKTVYLTTLDSILIVRWLLDRRSSFGGGGKT